MTLLSYNYTVITLTRGEACCTCGKSDWPLVEFSLPHWISWVLWSRTNSIDLISSNVILLNHDTRFSSLVRFKYEIVWKTVLYIHILYLSISNSDSYILTVYLRVCNNLQYTCKCQLVQYNLSYFCIAGIFRQILRHTLHSWGGILNDT